MYDLHALAAFDVVLLQMAEHQREGARQRLGRLARALSRLERREVAGPRPSLTELPLNRLPTMEGAVR